MSPKKMWSYFSFIMWVTVIGLFIACSDGSMEKQILWKRIEPYFSPPSHLSDNYGSYRSPLKFYDGRIVETNNDWIERRGEILGKWHKMMGTWPPLIERQELEFLDSVPRDNFIQYRVRFYWIPNVPTEGYLLVPDGKGNSPAVITVYYEPETGIGMGKENRDFAYQLAKRGFVTLSIGTSNATKAETWGLYYPAIENAKVEPLSMLAYVAANSWHVLANLKYVDSKRIGIVGHSYGGKWAMIASCLFDKFACAVWSDPGIVFDESRPNVNYWEPWYLGYHSPPWRERGVITEDNPAFGLYTRLVEEGYDLHELHALMAPRPFLVSGGSEDPPSRWEALNHTIAVNKLLGYESRVAMTNRKEHSPNPESNEQIYQFFEFVLKHDLP
jgi:hypothetical protein